MVNKTYKPHIDGLRALAVLPVILFHSGFESFKGGFIGVDIFFVISGYLITNIIIKDLSEKKFKIKDFYLRRARRILPALFVVTLISLFFSIFIMRDESLEFYSRQVISVIFFISNFYFWKNSGYFNPNSEVQPLLHTWSLSVEEQFYIFFPIFMIFIWKLKKRISLIIIIISFLSLFLAQSGGNFKLQNLTVSIPIFILPFDFFWQAGSANFFLPFGRAWELLAGSLVSIYKFNHKALKGNDFLSIIGFFFIIISIIFFSENLQYPSIFTILPVFGTAMIILNNNKESAVNKILSLKPLVFFGLISYSLYLWHQPVLAFNRLYFGINLSNEVIFFNFIIIFIISYLSWQFIEKPFRNKRSIDNKKVIKYLVFLFSAILVFSILIHSKKITSTKPKLPKILEQTMKIADNENCIDLEGSYLKEFKNWYCEIGDKTQKKISFVIAGDSHANAIKPVFDIIGKDKNKKGVLAAFSGCPHLIGVQSVRSDLKKRNCKKLNKKIFNFIKENKIKKIFLVSRWTYYTDGDYYSREFQHLTKNKLLFSNKKNSKSAFSFGLENTIKKYNEIGVEIIFIHQPPMQLYNPNFAYFNSYDFSKKTVDINKLRLLSVSYDRHINFQKFIRTETKKLLKKSYMFKEIDFDKFFCDKKKCMIGEKNISYYSDDDHLSVSGSKKIKKLIENNFN